MSRTSNRVPRLSVFDLSVPDTADGTWADFDLPWRGPGVFVFGYPVLETAEPIGPGDDFELRTSNITNADGSPVTWDPDTEELPTGPTMIGYFQFVITAEAGATIGIRVEGAGVWSTSWFVGWQPLGAIIPGVPS